MKRKLGWRREEGQGSGAKRGNRRREGRECRLRGMQVRGRGIILAHLTLALFIKKNPQIKKLRYKNTSARLDFPMPSSSPQIDGVSKSRQIQDTYKLSNIVKSFCFYIFNARVRNITYIFLIALYHETDSQVTNRQWERKS